LTHPGADQDPNSAPTVRHLRREAPSLNSRGRQAVDRRGFAWQEGYGAFSVSKSSEAEVRRYIQRQKEHHRRRDFEAEFIELLNRHEIEYDERYIWN